MRSFRTLDDLPRFRNAVITIGTYDGVHYGHQKIIKRINSLAQQLDGESVIITFHPHPRSVLQSDKSISLLSPLDEKFDLFRKYGVDNVVVVPFTRDFSQQSPEDYVRAFLHHHFQPKKIVIGYNHKFGKNRAGDLHFLKSLSSELNFEVEEIQKQELDELSISSTKIREALQNGQVDLANTLLGHTYFIRGVVVRGQQLGQKIGFPTANILVESKSKLIPQNGVYAVKVILREQEYKGMLNIGFRPTVNGLSKTIEVNIFDFNDSIYGEAIQVDFIKHIREEEKFVDIQALVKQLEKDRELSRSILEQA